MHRWHLLVRRVECERQTAPVQTVVRNLVSDYEESRNELKHLYAYDFSNAVDGATVSTWGKMAIPTSDEIESVTWAHRRWKDGHQTWITVGILDNDWPSKDDVMLRNFGVPNPAAL